MLPATLRDRMLLRSPGISGRIFFFFRWLSEPDEPSKSSSVALACWDPSPLKSPSLSFNNQIQLQQLDTDSYIDQICDQCLTMSAERK